MHVAEQHRTHKSERQEPNGTTARTNVGVDSASPAERRTIYAIDESANGAATTRPAQTSSDDRLAWPSTNDHPAASIEPPNAGRLIDESRPTSNSGVHADRQPASPHALSSWLVTWPSLDETSHRRPTNIDDPSRTTAHVAAAAESDDQPRDDRWPELPDLPAFATLIDGDGNDQPTRLQRLDDEQRGLSWSA